MAGGLGFEPRQAESEPERLTTISMSILTSIARLRGLRINGLFVESECILG